MKKPLTDLRAGIGLALAALLIYWVADYFFDLPSTALEFHSEIVRAIPDGTRVRFVGDYDFIAHHPRRTSYEIGYPTQNDSKLPPPADVIVKVNGLDLPVKILSQGLVFEMPVKLLAETHLHIEYTMNAPNHRATYITRTANLWPKPVTEARFVLTAGAKSNYHQPNTTETVFRIFRPSEDWNIQW
ncbi:hypothetical protein LLG95_06800 [bacterium]|nr:hypothetical protein [bacterium]